MCIRDSNNNKQDEYNSNDGTDREDDNDDEDDHDLSLIGTAFHQFRSQFYGKIPNSPLHSSMIVCFNL